MVRTPLASRVFSTVFPVVFREYSDVFWTGNWSGAFGFEPET